MLRFFTMAAITLLVTAAAGFAAFAAITPP